MKWEEAAAEFEDVKQHAISNQQIENVQLADHVMTRIESLQARKPKRSFMVARQFSILATIVLVTIVVSATVYAMSELIQIPSRSYIVGPEIKETEGELFYHPDSVQHQAYRDRVQEMMEPGQVLAYSIKDNAGLPAVDPDIPVIHYLHDIRISSSYDDFAELLLSTSAPVIQEPASLPEGLIFQYGSIWPRLPNQYDKRTELEYARLLELFQQRAEDEPSPDLLVEEVNWSEAISSEIEYRSDSLSLQISAFTGARMMSTAYPEGFVQEIVELAGTELILARGSVQGLNSYGAIWYDEEQNMVYNVKASVINGGSEEFTYEQFLLIVEGLLEK